MTELIHALTVCQPDEAVRGVFHDFAQTLATTLRRRRARLRRKR